MEVKEEKDLQLDRLVFFSDAVVAIAITLLALDLRLPRPGPEHLHWADVGAQWRTFAAFLLSFINIAGFWRMHYRFCIYLRHADDRLLGLNVGWLLFIVLLPFTTTLVSSYFTDKPAMLLYCLNTLVIAVLQNFIWDYVVARPALLKPQALSRLTSYYLRAYCNLEMLNAAVAVAVAFFSPALAFVLLFLKIPTMLIVWLFYGRRRARQRRRGRADFIPGFAPKERGSQ